MDHIVATVTLPGDRSVGIPDSEVTIDLGAWKNRQEFFDQFIMGLTPGREEFRRGIAEWANRWLSNCDSCIVTFDDECVRCGKVDCHCRRKYNNDY